MDLVPLARAIVGGGPAPTAPNVMSSAFLNANTRGGSACARTTSIKPMRVSVVIVSPSMSTGVPPRRSSFATSTTVTRYPSLFNQNAMARPAKLAPLTSTAWPGPEVM